MRAILQRVEKAAVRVGGEVVGEIGRGMLVLVGVEKGDGPADAAVLAAKLAGLRIFSDPEGKMNLAADAVDGDFLIVSQFTLGASLAKGRRPSFNSAAVPEEARPLVESVMTNLRDRGFRVAGGRFGASMKVELVNDGPVTFLLEARDGRIV
ncbi:MAG: D-tyrosyl-tRNA(Tyr) deacylase [bacterium]|nr:D-tyrosyl-tRNA(Tyr) deacylase [bacterium]